MAARSLAIAIAIGLGLISAPAQAAVQRYSLSVTEAQLGTGPFGTVTVSEISHTIMSRTLSGLHFHVALSDYSLYHFNNAKEANHWDFVFNVAGSNITISNLTHGFIVPSGSPFREPPFGSPNAVWQYAVDLPCSARSCAGFNRGFADALDFDVFGSSDLTLHSLASTLYRNQNIFFASDLVNKNGTTGNVGAVVTGVPEPSTWAMMLVGLIGLGALTRRRLARKMVASSAA